MCSSYSGSGSDFKVQILRAAEAWDLSAMELLGLTPDLLNQKLDMRPISLCSTRAHPDSCSSVRRGQVRTRWNRRLTLVSNESILLANQNSIIATFQGLWSDWLCHSDINVTLVKSLHHFGLQSSNKKIKGFSR